MTTITVLLLLLSVILAGGVSFFQYFYKAKSNSKINWILAFLRFCAILGLLLLLINPRLIQKSFETIKMPLPIVVDNSSSIDALNSKETVQKVYQELVSNAKLKEKFDIQSYRFSIEFEASEEIDFKGNQTRLDLVASGLKNNLKNYSMRPLQNNNRERIK